jgi:hypothetical protein
VPNVLVQHDSQDKQRALFGLTGEALAARIQRLLSTAHPAAREDSPQPPHIRRSAR